MDTGFPGPSTTYQCGGLNTLPHTTSGPPTWPPCVGNFLSAQGALMFIQWHWLIFKSRAPPISHIRDLAILFFFVFIFFFSFFFLLFPLFSSFLSFSPFLFPFFLLFLLFSPTTPRWPGPLYWWKISSDLDHQDLSNKGLYRVFHPIWWKVSRHCSATRLHRVMGRVLNDTQFVNVCAGTLIYPRDHFFACQIFFPFSTIDQNQRFYRFFFHPILLGISLITP